ncbi:hypothetical protein HMPREF1155_0759 [Slackia sp. CM382]|nr:hypothetical protein HMPREF1155_0759 [Slackia sp. CM382]
MIRLNPREGTETKIVSTTDGIQAIELIRLNPREGTETLTKSSIFLAIIAIDQA